MIRYIKRTLQVTLLTAMLVFSGLLIMGSFDTPSWSASDHVTHETYSSWWFIHTSGHESYASK